MTNDNDELESMTKTLFGCSAAGCLIIIATGCAIVLIFLVGALIFGACQQDEWASPDLGRDEVVVAESFSHHTLRDDGHLDDRIEFPEVVSLGKFGDVPIEVLVRHVMGRANVAALEHGPERLDAVGMRHVPQARHQPHPVAKTTKCLVDTGVDTA